MPRQAWRRRLHPGRSGSEDESGAAIVEFAIVVPLLLALVFGMFSGGLAYNRKLTLTNAVREGSRYGATLAVAQARSQTACTSTDAIDCWLAQVATITEKAADGELGTSVGSRRVCVAYISSGAGPDDATRSRVRTSASADVTTPGGTCFDDGRPPGERRVQVSAQRDGKLELVLRSTKLTLKSQSVTRFEARS